MGWQDKIAQFNVRAKRKHFDYRVAISGTNALVFRFRTIADDWNNRQYVLLNNEVVPMVLQLPEDLPMHRMRKVPLEGDITPVMEPGDADAQSIFLYDTLPIKGWSAFHDDVENGDLVVFKIDTDDPLPYVMALQVTYTFANVDQSRMVSKRHNLAPYTAEFKPEMIAALETYRDSF